MPNLEVATLAVRRVQNVTGDVHNPIKLLPRLSHHQFCADVQQ